MSVFNACQEQSNAHILVPLSVSMGIILMINPWHVRLVQVIAGFAQFGKPVNNVTMNISFP